MQNVMQNFGYSMSGIFLFWKKEVLLLKGSLFFWICLSALFFLDGFFSFWTHVLYGTTELSLFFSNMLFVIMIISSMIGGKLISEEKQNGTLSLLLTKPIPIKFFVWGKLAFSASFWGVFFICSFLWNYLLCFSSEISWKFITVNYLGFFLLTLYLQTIAFVFSSIFEGQFVSVVSSVFAFFFCIY